MAVCSNKAFNNNNKKLQVEELMLKNLLERVDPLFLTIKYLITKLELFYKFYAIEVVCLGNSVSVSDC